MYGARHHLAEEFPEFTNKIEFLKNNNDVFARLLTKYDETDRRIVRLEQQQCPVADSYVEQLKWWRVHLKDMLYGMLRKPQVSANS